MWLRGENRFSKPMPTLFHTSHPGLSAALRRDRRWVQVSAVLSGGSRAKSAASLLASYNNGRDVKADARGYYGGHWRAVQGFRYLGEYSPRLKEGA
jgi:hypothetical protein